MWILGINLQNFSRDIYYAAKPLGTYLGMSVGRWTDVDSTFIFWMWKSPLLSRGAQRGYTHCTIEDASLPIIRVVG